MACIMLLSPIFRKSGIKGSSTRHTRALLHSSQMRHQQDGAQLLTHDVPAQQATCSHQFGNPSNQTMLSGQHNPPTPSLTEWTLETVHQACRCPPNSQEEVINDNHVHTPAHGVVNLV
jgi:hypothetical protein